MSIVRDQLEESDRSWGAGDRSRRQKGANHHTLGDLNWCAALYAHHATKFHSDIE